MSVELGLIEGYYGRPWTWNERESQAEFLQRHGYGFYLYAPKADAYLRTRWREPWPEATQAALERFAGRCRALGLRFGVGLSPFEVYLDFNAAAKEALARRLADFDALGVQDLGIFFDDMRGDVPNLAATQIEILHWIAERSPAARIIFCPTYYSDDVQLDRGFGQRPTGYLEALGAGLDPKIEVFWTGEEVCSREYSPGHLNRVAEQIRRKPVLWDNYPVNDGPRMSPFLYVRAFTGRPGAIGASLSGHAVNPALQPVLSRIPLASLAESYRLGEAYEYGAAFDRAAAEVLGEELGALVRRHLLTFQEVGVDRLEPDTKQRLRARYGAFDHPGAREILKWVDGGYTVTREMMEAEERG
ncbi:MAG TPA: beta-N-acetylglucosaminidase domain-containing protein [Caulobacteraceae bacterium]|nr:beta-N-acetylglucosaminidase domain-containing protein [Caulobacteraceae bacterium]